MTAPTTDPAGADRGDVRDAKRALRLQVLAQRDRMPAAARGEAGRAIVTALAARADFDAALTLLLTLPFGSEWDTRPLVALAQTRRKIVVVPRVNRPANILELAVVNDLDRDVAPGYRGILEPRAHCAALALEAVDWVLAPGVAFDPTGHRVGYGGGHFDRLLSSLPAAVPRIAGAFDMQIVASVPLEAHDLAVDAIVTESRTIAAAR
ncbi:MAG: 5-formyltetrahydrofolate cyclo-ligase [Casimicrobiaceae bacterium]